MASHGEKYGHLYEGLDLAEEVKGHVVVKRRADGEWDLPAELVF